jgi:uncharacterized phage infection (PIP) family protein YhgE
LSKTPPLAAKKIDATLAYALKHLESQMEQSRQNFSLLVKNLNLELKNDKKLQKHIDQLIQVVTNFQENTEIRSMVLKETLPAMLKASQTNSEQRHALLAQQLKQTVMLPPHSPNLLLK